MKKRIAMAALALSVVLSAGTTSAFAHGHGYGPRNGQGHRYHHTDSSWTCPDPNGGCSFVDANGDGICDNAAAGLCPGHGWRGHGC